MHYFREAKDGLLQPKLTHDKTTIEIELTSTYSSRWEVTTSPTDCFTSFLTCACIFYVSKIISAPLLVLLHVPGSNPQRYLLVIAPLKLFSSIFNSSLAIRGFRGACYMFFTSKIHSIKKMKKNAPIRIRRAILITAQIYP
jgi:hypothetical protein